MCRVIGSDDHAGRSVGEVSPLAAARIRRAAIGECMIGGHDPRRRKWHVNTVLNASWDASYRFTGNDEKNFQNFLGMQSICMVLIQVSDAS